MKPNSEDIRIVEALIFSSEKPLSVEEINSLVGDILSCPAEIAMEALSHRLENTDSALSLRRIAGGFRLMTREDLFLILRKLKLRENQTKLSQAALEVLSIISYRQPVTRPDIQAVRGVNSDGVLRGLMEKKLVTIVGRSKKAGRALLYGTTSEFLEYFGLNSIEDLPSLKEIQKIAERDGEISIEEDFNEAQ
ncbi:MAG: SMC-Scp complex subunit ScpB [Candidatus Marinimicrobia bacterium]|nr:SMC-Scp complex subunit ScpB [Candidatus Neomarinimicrobiota bacterium]